jgi:hypothetical protein
LNPEPGIHAGGPGFFIFQTEKGGHMKNFIVVLNLIFLATGGWAAAAPDYIIDLRYENRRWIPETIVVPANRRVTVKIVNASHEAIEFESFKLNREKVVGPGETVTITLPALKPGRYDFYDDFHADVPQGTIVAK